MNRWRTAFDRWRTGVNGRATVARHATSWNTRASSTLTARVSSCCISSSEYAELGEERFKEFGWTQTFADAVDQYWPGSAAAWSALDALGASDS